MTELKISNYLIAILIISVCVTAYLTFFATAATRYSVNTDTSDFQATYNKMIAISNSTDALYNSTAGLSADKEAQFFTFSVDVVKNTFKLLRNTLSLGADILTDTSTKYIKFPPYIVTAMQAILVILLVGTIIYLIMKVKW